MSIKMKARVLRTHQTPAEQVFWEFVRKKRYRGHHFGRQHVFRHAGTHTAGAHYIVDFYCAALKLCVELDGGIHESQRDYDEARDDALREMGYRVLRLENEVVLGARGGEVYGLLDEFLEE